MGNSRRPPRRELPLPTQVVQAARWAILDAVGVALAGSQVPPGIIAAEVAREEAAREEAAVFGQGFRSSPATAAFANGVAAHALDFDASFAIMGQPMAGLVPTVFALSARQRASGRELIGAYVAGYEV